VAIGEKKKGLGVVSEVRGEGHKGEKEGTKVGGRRGGRESAEQEKREEAFFYPYHHSVSRHEFEA